MVIYYSFDVAHATVAQFERVSVENFVETIRFGEMLVDQGEETFSHVGCYILTVRGVELRGVHWRVSSCMWSFTIGKVVVVSALI